MNEINFVTKEFHTSEDCIVGDCLKVIGRKFKRNYNQNFVKIEGPADCWIHKECSLNVCQTVKCSQELKNFKNFGYCVGNGFRKKKDLIVEPERGYDGLDYKGERKHAAKAYSHTPSTQFNVKAIGCLFALGYLDINRQKRSGNIELIQVELSKSYEKI